MEGQLPVAILTAASPAPILSPLPQSVSKH